MRNGPRSAGLTPTRRLLSLVGCIAATTLVGACGGSQSATPAGKPATPTSQSAAPTGLDAQLAPFLGRWSGGHAGVVEINSGGTGRFTYSDTSSCPNAPLAGCGVTGSADFTLTSIAKGTATGSVTASSNPSHDTVGEPVTIVLGSANGKGAVLAVSLGKMKDWNFCNDTSTGWCAEG
jgi:hypothetical protein